MTNSPSPKQQLLDIYQLVRQNHQQEARRLLQQYFKDNAPDADAYYIATFLTNDLNRKIQMCERALQINPNHGPVMQLLEKLQGELEARDTFSNLNASIDDEAVEVANPSSTPEPQAEPILQAEAAAPAPFVDTWSDEPSKPSKSNTRTSTQRNGVLFFVAGLVLGLLIVGSIAALVISRSASQPTPAPIVLVVTATEPILLPTNLPTETSTPRPPTRTRPPTFTPIPTRTSGSAFNRNGTSSAPTSSVGTPNKTINELSFMVEDAEYSTSLDKIIFVASEPNALYIYDPETQSHLTIVLDRKPTCISVSVDGKFAAVGHEGLVTYVDLTTATIVKTLEFSDTAYDIALLSTGWVAVMPPNTYNTLYLFEVLTSQQSIVESHDIYPGGHLQRDANGSGIYVISTRLSPGAMDHVTFEDGKLADVQNWDPSYTRRLKGETLEHCDNAWLASDNKRIFARCGTIFQADPDPSQDMVPAGNLTEIGAADGVVFVPSQRKLVALGKSSTRVSQGIPDWDAPQILYTYDSDTLALETSTILPAFRAGYPGDGGYLFVNAAGTHYYALLGYQSYINDNHNRTKNQNTLFGIAVGDVGGGSAVAVQATPAVTNAPSSASTPTANSPTGTGNVKPLPYQVLDARFSSTLNRMIMIAKDDLALHIYDPVTDTDQQVALQRMPTSISISTDGNFAAVGQDAMMSYIDLKTQSVIKTFDVPFAVTRSILANNGWVYLSGLNSSQRAITLGIELATGRQGKGVFGSMHPDGRIYSAGTDYLNVVNLSDPANPKVITSEPPTFPTPRVKKCGPLWFTDDRQRIFTGCATVLRASPDARLDGEYTGKLDSLTSVSALAISTLAHKVVAIGKLASPETVIDTKLVIYNYDTLNVENVINLSTLNGSTPAHGKFVFIDADGKHYYVLTQGGNGGNFNVVRGQFDDTALDSTPLTPRTPVPNLEAAITPLEFAVSDAAYSKPLDRIIMTVAVSMQVIIFNPADHSKEMLQLDHTPTSLHLTPDALTAVVGQDGLVSLIDLKGTKVLQVYQTDRLVRDAVFASNGFIYALIKPAQGENINMLAFDTKTSKTYQFPKIPSASGILQTLPVGQHLYLVQNISLHGTVYRIDVEQDGNLANVAEWVNRDNYSACQNAWVSDDATRLLTRCGNIFKTSVDSAQDMIYNGQLLQTLYITSTRSKGALWHRWITDSVAAKVILSLPDLERFDWVGRQPQDQQVLMFDIDSLQYLASIPLPKIGPADKLAASEGQFVFINATGDRMYVIMKAVDGSGLLNDYGVWISPLPKKAN